MITRFIVESTFDVVADRCSGDEIVFICVEPGCGDQGGNRSVNAKTHKTSCWRCGKGGDFFKWAKRLGYDIENEAPNLSADDVFDEVEKIIKESEKRVVPIYVSPITLPKGFTRIEDDPDCYHAVRIERMAKRKRLRWKDMVKAGVGFTQEGKWEPFAIFPVTEWGVTTYFQGRTYNDPEEGSTKKFPSRSEVPLGSRYWLYNIDRLREEKASKIILVESILNVLSLERELELRNIEGVVPLAIFKHHISKEQAAKLAALSFLDEICLMFDSDATKDAYKSVSHAYKLSPEMFTIVEMPEGVDANDDAELAVDGWLKRKSGIRSPIATL